MLPLFFCLSLLSNWFDHAWPLSEISVGLSIRRCLPTESLKISAENTSQPANHGWFSAISQPCWCLEKNKSITSLKTQMEFGEHKDTSVVRQAWVLRYYHQEFQVPKMEVLNLIRLFLGWVFPYISLTYSLHKWVPPFWVPEKFGDTTPISQWLFLVPVKSGIGGTVHPPIGRKNATYIPLIVLSFWGVICYLPPFTGTRNNHWIRIPWSMGSLWYQSKHDLLQSGYPYDTTLIMYCIYTSTFKGVPIKPSGMANWHPLGTIWHPFEGGGIYNSSMDFKDSGPLF